MPINRLPTFAGLAVLGAIGAAAIFILPSQNGVSETDAFVAPGLDPMTIEEARSDFLEVDARVAVGGL